MATTDSKGIIRYEAGDSVSPIHTALNLGLDSVSTALDSPLFNTPAGVHVVANSTELAPLRTTMTTAGYPTTDPLYAHRKDTGLLYVQPTSGDSWSVYPTTPPIGWARNLTGDLTLTSPITGNSWISNRVTIPAEPFAKTVTSTLVLYGIAPTSSQWDLVLTSDVTVDGTGTRSRFSPSGLANSVSVTYTQTVPANTVSYVRAGVLHTGAVTGNLTLSTSGSYRDWHVSVQPTN